MKILVIEDHSIQFKLLKLKLSNLNINELDLENAQTLSSAIQSLESSKFDLIVCDLMLPDARDFEALDAVYEKSNGTPIIVLSGKDDIGDIEEIINKGAKQFIPKDSNFASLVSDAIVAQIESQINQ